MGFLFGWHLLLLSRIDTRWIIDLKREMVVFSQFHLGTSTKTDGPDCALCLAVYPRIGQQVYRKVSCLWLLSKLTLVTHYLKLGSDSYMTGRYAAPMQEWIRLGVCDCGNVSQKCDNSRGGWQSFFQTHFMHGKARHWVDTSF